MLSKAPADAVKPLYLQYAKLEEDYGLAKRAMKVYDQATKAVPNSEKLAMYEIYVTRTLEMFGVPKAREIYEQAIQSGLPDKDVKTLCLNYAEIEKRMGEIDRARGIYCFSAQFADPRIDQDFWNKWREFEVQHGNEDTYRDMLHLKRTVVSHFILSEYLMQKDQKLDINEAKEKLKQAEICIDGMADLERHLAPIATGPTPTDDKREVGFVSAGLQVQTDDGLKLNANEEDIELPEEIESEDERVEISQRKVPAAVFGVLDQMGGLERIKRQRRS